MTMMISVKNKVYKNGYRRRSCTSETAKIHRFVRFVVYCIITTVTVAFYCACYCYLSVRVSACTVCLSVRVENSDISHLLHATNVNRPRDTCVPGSADMFNRRVPDVLDWQTWRRQLNHMRVDSIFTVKCVANVFALLKMS